MVSLVGYTGFVGSNILASAGSRIEGLYNSSNIEEAYGTNPDILIYAGLRAEKYLANNDPDKDMELIIQAEHNIESIAPKRLVLISTVDVLKDTEGKDENSEIITEGLHPYGYDRYVLEQWTGDRYQDALIIRLPALFGINIKKNFIYDYINVIPYMLSPDRYHGLDTYAAGYYEALDNGFYRLRQDITDDEKAGLKSFFRNNGFNALSFTDSRSVYQFYDLGRLWNDINLALDKGITLWHPATEPVSAAEVYRYLSGKNFDNVLDKPPAMYDYRTVHADVFGGRDGYIMNKDDVLMRIKEFVDSQQEH